MKPYLQLLRLIIPFLLICIIQASAQPPQIFIQLEDQLTDQIFRYHIGDDIQIKTKEYSDNWQNLKIVDIIPKDDIVVFDDGFVKLKDITRVRRKKGKGGKIIGGTLMSLGAGILVFGTLGTLADDSTSSAVGPAIIGGLTTALGWLITKTGRRKKFTIGKHTHLRIYDIRWPEPRRS